MPGRAAGRSRDGPRSGAASIRTPPNGRAGRLRKGSFEPARARSRSARHRSGMPFGHDGSSRPLALPEDCNDRIGQNPVIVSLLRIRPGEARLAFRVLAMMFVVWSGFAVGGNAVEGLLLARFGPNSLPYLF